MQKIAAVALGALLFLWPAILNGYPIVFSDTGGFLEQALMPDTGWDKPWIYGPFLTPLHLKLSLWPAALAQALLLSAALWLILCRLAPPATAGHHIALCATLALLTAAPWFASLMMPDIFTPLVVIGIYLLAWGPPTIRHRTHAAIALLTAIAIAAHLAHLIVAAACLASVAILRPRALPRAAVPLAAAIALLLASNLIAFGRLAISPYGATFALARLVADGPARDLIEQRCPEAAWRLCAWKGRLPTDSDDFLWDPYGPVWAKSYGPLKIAPEAALLVQETIRTHPILVLTAALANTARQLVRTTIGDALIPDHLPITMIPRLQAYFPPAETARFQASHQANGRLPGLAAPLNPLYTIILLLAAPLTLAVALLTWRTHPQHAAFAAIVLVALVANAFATGALSGPHDRYQARIAWLLLVPPAAWFLSTRSQTPSARPSSAAARSRR